MRTQACTMGKSWLRMPVVSICPIPGIVKIFSMMTAPLMTQGIDMKNMIVTKEIERKMDKTPLYSQDGKGDAAKVLFKVFNPYGGQSWYILEAGPVVDGDRELFVLSVANGEAEYGYMMLSDLTETRVNVWGYRMPFERDRWFNGTVGDAKREEGVA